MGIINKCVLVIIHAKQVLLRMWRFLDVKKEKMVKAVILIFVIKVLKEMDVLPIYLPILPIVVPLLTISRYNVLLASLLLALENAWNTQIHYLQIIPLKFVLVNVHSYLKMLLFPHALVELTGSAKLVGAAIQEVEAQAT